MCLLADRTLDTSQDCIPDVHILEGVLRYTEVGYTYLQVHSSKDYRALCGGLHVGFC